MPTYNSPVLQDQNYGWICYANTTILPHILDFQDTIAPYNQITVKPVPLSSAVSSGARVSAAEPSFLLAELVVWLPIAVQLGFLTLR